MRTLYFCPVVSSFFLSFFPRLISAVADLMSAILRTWCGLSANLRCRSETCCTWLAENTGCKKSPKNRHLGTVTQLHRAISSQLRHVSTIEKKLVKQQYLLHMSPQYVGTICPHNNFGPLTAEIGPLVWGTPANFNGFRILAALLQGTPVLGVSQTLQR